MRLSASGVTSSEVLVACLIRRAARLALDMIVRHVAARSQPLDWEGGV